MRTFQGWCLGSLVTAATLVTVSACSTAEAPTEPVTPVVPGPSISASPGSEPVAPAPTAPDDHGVAEAHEAPAPVAVAEPSVAATEYPGTWLGLCTKLQDCGCSEWSAATTCETALSTGYEAGLAQAVSMGLPPEMLEQARMTPDKLSEISNESCPRICEAAAQFSAATRGLPTP